MADKTTNLLRLLDLEKQLKYKGNDDLGLISLDALRKEVHMAIQDLKDERKTV